MTFYCVVVKFKHMAKKIHVWEYHWPTGRNIYFEHMYIFVLLLFMVLWFWSSDWLDKNHGSQKGPHGSLTLWSLPVLSLPSVSVLMNSNSVNCCFSLEHLPPLPPPPFSCEKWALHTQRKLQHRNSCWPRQSLLDFVSVLARARRWKCILGMCLTAEAWGPERVCKVTGARWRLICSL